MNWQDKEFHEQVRKPVPSWQLPARQKRHPVQRTATPANAGTIAAIAIIAFLVIVLTH